MLTAPTKRNRFFDLVDEFNLNLSEIIQFIENKGIFQAYISRSDME
jgi:hypothetical protein